MNALNTLNGVQSEVVKNVVNITSRLGMRMEKLTVYGAVHWLSQLHSSGRLSAYGHTITFTTSYPKLVEYTTSLPSYSKLSISWTLYSLNTGNVRKRNG